MATLSQLHSHGQLLQVVVVAASALLIQPAIAERNELPMTLVGCPDKCGNMSIPFPFGMTSDCFLDKGFEVICNDTFDPPRAFLPFRSGGSAAQVTTVSYYSDSKLVGRGDLEISPVELIGISVAESEARAYGAVASACNTNATDVTLRSTFTTLAFEVDGPTAPLLVSLTRNVLVGVGVEVQPLVSKLNTVGSKSKDDHLASCRSNLMGDLQQASNGSCSGRGCCQASFPKTIPLTGVSVVVPTRSGMNPSWETSPCSFAMVVETSWYNFSTTDLYGNTHKFFPRGVPYVVDFAVRNAKCPAQGQQPPPGYACVGGNTSCADVTNGYVCKCLEHYEGNPYIPHGCQDIDECELPDLYPCSSDGICKNRLLGYDCPCKPGMKGDGKAGTCQDVFPLVAKMVVGVIGCFIVAAALLFFILLRREKKKMREFYEKNGGPILEKAKTIKLFKKEELKEILKSSNLIGKGFFGEVYKGVLDNQLVAVKKPINGSVLENEQFANEVIIQSQIIHKNIVRLIGCCLEVDIPILVYEFITKGNLEDILHSNNKVVPLNLDMRVSIAAQSANGLAYMHSKTNNKILHGDVKPANILLDENFMPKISDFGISRLIARDKQHTNEIIGDISYMDPVYKATGLLTEKSDVYSFGVVILELISRKRATHSDNNSLIRNFLKAHEEEKIATELFDMEFAGKPDLHILDSMTKIAVECLNDDVDKRPSMIEVAERLLLLNRSPEAVFP